MKPWAWALAASAAALLVARIAKGQTVALTGTTDDPDPRRYKPGSPRAVSLLTQAAQVAGLPESWATSPDVHKIMGKESKGGWVGIPNYLWAKYLGTSVAKMHASPDLWPQVWAVIKAGNAKPSFTGIGSHAAGLGQLQPSNMAAFQPSGVQGVGDPLEEAVGFLRYIENRYGTPEVAAQMYGKLGTYTHGKTGFVETKKFKEGY